VIQIPVGLPAELVPLSWLIGEWEGDGVVDYRVNDDRQLRRFHQRVSFLHRQGRTLEYHARADVSRQAGETAPGAPETGSATFPFTESGYWSLRRELGRRDDGPAMVPGDGEHRPFDSAEAVETLRNADGGFDIQAEIVHSDGIAEMYAGTITGPRLDLKTSAVLGADGSHDYAAATRMYGLVEGHLLWAWDIAALGQDMRTHASARLVRVTSPA
jgi:hypothetical protein